MVGGSRDFDPRPQANEYVDGGDKSRSFARDPLADCGEKWSSATALYDCPLRFIAREPVPVEVREDSIDTSPLVLEDFTVMNPETSSSSTPELIKCAREEAEE